MREDELRTVNLFKVLANPIRYRILKNLAHGEYTVSELSKRIGRESSNISQHLSLLRQHQLVRFRTQKTQVFYRLKRKEILLLLQKANEFVRRKG
ncbi:winged helix-turn-helix transcriptional regulator [candidate division TA06 bacterium]|nr:winged helix-turn-helix transcriptional regulator [candidate division TA06 bacterium]